MPDESLDQVNDLVLKSNDQIKNIFLQGVITIGITISIIVLVEIYTRAYPPVLYLITILLTFVGVTSSVLSMKNKKAGYFMNNVLMFFNTITVTIASPVPFSGLISFYDGLAILVPANIGGLKSYIISSIVISTKITITHFSFGNAYRVHEIIISIINALTIGIIPILVKRMRKLEILAQHEEENAEKIALKTQSSIQLISQAKKENFVSAEIKEASSTYESPYASDSSSPN